MANDAKKLQPIIVKKIKKAGHAAHGGAWKIAYADFVTAMMAFFLLMWLLGSTAQGDLKGIADYFNSPLRMGMGGGTGSGDSASILKGGGQDLTRQSGQVKHSEESVQKRNTSNQSERTEARRLERARLDEIKRKVDALLSANGALAQFKNQIRLDITSEGLRIQIVDEQNRPMFDSGRAVLKDHARLILAEIGRALGDVENKLAISGHTDAAPFPGPDRGYGNWDLSADRANAARRELTTAGLDEKKVLRVVGLASSVPFKPEDPLDPSNRRISIVVLNRDAEETVTNGGPVADDNTQAVSGDVTVQGGPTAPAAANGAPVAARQAASPSVRTPIR